MPCIRPPVSKTPFCHIVQVFGTLYFHYEKQNKVGKAQQIVLRTDHTAFEYTAIRYVQTGVTPGEELEKIIEQGDRSCD